MDSCGDQMIDILTKYLKHTNEQFNTTLERCEMPPYYRWQSVCDVNEKVTIANYDGTSTVADSIDPPDTNASTVAASELFVPQKQVFLESFRLFSLDAYLFAIFLFMFKLI
ncbi:unnamed protein product [Anisakis simplex]|uniref:Uncharacterized protein n=1 Tax=Anisakis simplex TaxID=6269 RepID=A0A0M3JLG2_ANISI|nr:unnamed protein product [Anisakis simplex]